MKKQRRVSACVFVLHVGKHLHRLLLGKTGKLVNEMFHLVNMQNALPAALRCAARRAKPTPDMFTDAATDTHATHTPIQTHTSQ